jgi:hypothetical protein
MNESSDIAGMPTVEDPAIARIRGWNRFYKVTVIWLIGWVGLIVEKVVKLDSIPGGLREGFLGGVFVSPFMLILTLPLGWLGSRIGSWKRWRQYQIWFTFALPSLYVLMGIAGALHGRFFPQERFQRIAGVEFPRDARIERCVIDDGVGPFYDWGLVYELTCPAQETYRLVRELKLKERSSSGLSSGRSTTPGGWVADGIWWGNGVREGIYIELQADASRTKLRIYCFTT